MGCNCTKEAIVVSGSKFYVINRIADGGFGSIDLIEESRTGRSLALKRVKCESKNDLELVSRENKYYKQLCDNSNLGFYSQNIINIKNKTNYFRILIHFLKLN
jgi:serine/threonine protein kinase